MLRRLIAIAAKEFRQLRRDRLTFGMIVGVPVLQILLFGYAIDFDVRQLDAAVADQASTTSASRQLVAAAEATQVVRIRRTTSMGPEALEDLLERGAIEVGLHVPDDFERRRLDRDRPLAQLLINGSDPTIEGHRPPSWRECRHRVKPRRGLRSKRGPSTTPSAARRCTSCRD
jgi:ABC-2 type transport system permease protein